MSKIEVFPPMRELQVLVQADLLEPAHSTMPVEALSDQELQAQWNLCNTICLRREYAAVAGTQIRVLPEEQRNSIYIHEGYGSLSHLLLLNPRQTVIGDKQFVTIEGCGSIQNGRRGSVVLRQMHSRLSCVGYSPEQGRVQIDMVLEGRTSGVVEHEMEHLQGNTIIDYPNKLVPIDQFTAQTIFADYNTGYSMGLEELLTIYLRYSYFDSWLTVDFNGVRIIQAVPDTQENKGVLGYTWTTVQE